MTDTKPRLHSCGAVMLLASSGWVCPNCPDSKIIPVAASDRKKFPKGCRIERQLDEDEEPEVCAVCEGTGEVECDDCDGSGFGECPECGHDIDCDTCGGDGMIDCPECGGE